MKIKIEFDAPQPADAQAVLTAIKMLLMQEYNPGEWKRPDVHEITAYSYNLPRGQTKAKQIAVRIEVGEQDRRKS